MPSSLKASPPAPDSTVRGGDQGTEMEEQEAIEMHKEVIEISGDRCLYNYTFTLVSTPKPGDEIVRGSGSQKNATIFPQVG